MISSGVRAILDIYLEINMVIGKESAMDDSDESPDTESQQQYSLLVLIREAMLVPTRNKLRCKIHEVELSGINEEDERVSAFR